MKKLVPFLICIGIITIHAKFSPPIITRGVTQQLREETAKPMPTQTHSPLIQEKSENQLHEKTDAHDPKKDFWVTIFTHGGGAHPLYLNFTDTFKILNDNIDTSVYTKTTALLRKDPYFQQVQPEQGVGMIKAWPVQNITKNPLNGAQVFGKFFSEINNFVGLPSTELYSFGWTGLLSPQARRKAAQKFYDAIAQLVDRIKKEGYNPRIRIIAYSHGGNVALLLGEVVRNKGYTSFHIDELVLISTPVHINTQRYLKSSLFKKVYLFYSKGDNIQSSDFLSSPTHSFAHHFFLEKEGGKIPTNVTQIQIRIFRTKIITRLKNGTLKVIPRYEMVHPNHTEMFFFGWTPEWYRKYFPIKPMSVGLFIPFFLKTIAKYHLEGKHLRFTLRPEDEEMIIKVKNEKKVEDFEVPFFTQQELVNFRKELQEYKPTNVGYKEYHEEMKKRWKEAKKYISNIHKQKEKAIHQKKKVKTGPACNVALFNKKGKVPEKIIATKSVKA